MNRKNNEKEYTFADVLNADIRKIIKDRLKELDINQTELAKRMGKSRANISVLLSQHNVLSIPSIIAFCKALDMEFQIKFEKRNACASAQI